jgi:hypothetical protein
VALDDAGADGQPHPHPLRLGGIERVKNLLQPLGLNAAAGIGDLDDHFPVRVGGAEGDGAGAILHLGHRLNRIHHQIQQHLLDLHAIAGDKAVLAFNR